MDSWTALERDSLSELINMGMGQAAASLSELVGSEVFLNTPKLEFVDRADAIRRLRPDANFDIIGISQRFTGPFRGTASILFPHVSSLEIINLIIKEELPPEILAQMEQESMKEIGNIILNACLATMANNLVVELDTALPDFTLGTVEEVMAEDGADDAVNILCQVLFSIESNAMEGHVYFMIGRESVGKLHEAIRAYVKDIA